MRRIRLFSEAPKTKTQIIAEQYTKAFKKHTKAFELDQNPLQNRGSIKAFYEAIQHGSDYIATEQKDLAEARCVNSFK